MEGIYTFPINFSLGEMTLTVFPTLITGNGDNVLVDCGYPDSVPQLEAKLNKIGISLGDVTKIIITHHDHDHMGALKELKDTYPSIEILCTAEQAPYITGQKKSLRLRQAEDLQDSLPDAEKESGLHFQQFIASIQKVDTVTEITAGTVLPLCGGIEVIDTKGHMPGHISLYVSGEKALITGDALVVEDGKLCMAMPQYVLNRQDAEASVKRLLDYDIERIICYHGGVYDTNPKKSLVAVVDSFQ